MFAAGAAEVVGDPALMKEALERPGEVVRVLRGSAAEHIEALGTEKKKEAGSRIPRSGSRAGKSGMTKGGGSRIKSGMTKSRGPRPGRLGVEKAEAALERAEARQRGALEKLGAEAAALERRRKELERAGRGERERLMRAVDKARERYRAAMVEWAR